MYCGSELLGSLLVNLVSARPGMTGGSGLSIIIVGTRGSPEKHESHATKRSLITKMFFYPLSQRIVTKYHPDLREVGNPTGNSINSTTLARTTSPTPRSHKQDVDRSIFADGYLGVILFISNLFI